MHIVMETDRMMLRRFTVADVDIIVELDGDPAVMRFLTGGQPTPRSEVESEILPRILRTYEETPNLGRWAALAKSSGQFLGWFALSPTQRGNADDEVELGYRLRRSSWGQGYATEGSRALIHKAFTELGIERIFAETMAVNTPSRRVMERSGLRFVRVFQLAWDDPIEGTEHGEVEYELRRADWQPAV